MLIGGMEGGIFRHMNGVHQVSRLGVAGPGNFKQGIYDMASGQVFAGQVDLGLTNFGLFYQNAGTVQITNRLSLGESGGYGNYSIQSGQLTTGTTELGTGGTGLGNFDQYGGTHETGHLIVRSNLTHTSEYELINGMLLASNITTESSNGFLHQGGTNIVAGMLTGGYILSGGYLQAVDVSLSSPPPFLQFGGEHRVNTLSVGTSEFESNYTLGGGTLEANSVRVNHGVFHQTNGVAHLNFLGVSSFYNHPVAALEGGSLTITNTYIGGGAYGSFYQYGGVFRTSLLRVSGDTYFAYGSFLLRDGSVIADQVERGIGGSIRLEGGEMSISGDMLGGISLSGGLLKSANTYVGDAYFPATFFHSGGTNITTNTFVIGGNQNTTYILSGGLLDCSNLVVSSYATLDMRGGRLTQRGALSLAGRIYATGNQDFGNLIVSENAQFELPEGSCVQRFKDSSGMSWSGLFNINHWNGSTSGNGLHRIYVGTNANALTRSQLARIRFVSPSNLPYLVYFGKILSTGEVVPTPECPIFLSQEPDKLILDWPTGTWPNSFVLQRSTNVAGPYFDVPGAFSPYTNDLNGQASFFRLRSN